ncbi:MULTISPECIES: hypothetical protein [Sphingobium]|jgi:hypothetical protein|uniref:Uncharacterized protein n=3 Tax=Sphingobium TaxID=165695 RepID=A0A6P1GGI9_SPHYA|nr:MULTISPECIES: hypothetical protein [Sphingobium]EQB16528.1 hypothetical protein RLDS_06850 [Sphingobium lactosutens DS20]QDC36664.1 hypothetical protein FIL70_04830 [Sphingobium fuliginis ATCC 27551]QHD66761.1 hypothetical protein GS397_06650 [Sphingobium yanoikuyae]QNG43850.1 hypothetical protein H3V42_18195 [Sphingobium yanoikuyae]
MTHGDSISAALAADAASSKAPQYLELTEDDFLDRFHVTPNHLSDTAGFDFGEGGCLFEASGPELAFVLAQPPSRVWTIVEGDDGMEITDGMHVVNRLGYLVTARSCPPNTTISVLLDA